MKFPENLEPNFDEESKEFNRLLGIIKILRSPEGCPWDREQTPETLRGSLLDECLEVLQGINAKDTDNVREELGDVLLVVFLISRIFEEDAKGFHASMLQELNEKLIRRHPHVFGNSIILDSEGVVKQWDVIKSIEKNKKSLLSESIPKGYPPMEKSYEIQKKASKLGFDWGSPEPVIEKVKEELEEVQQELIEGSTEKLEEELGDLIFSAINLARACGVHPSLALERTNKKFLERFSYIEEKMAERGLSLEKKNLDQMEIYWTDAKTKGHL